MILIEQSPEQAQEVITLQGHAVPSTFRFVETQTRCAFELQQIAGQISEAGGIKPTIDFRPLATYLEDTRLLLRTQFTFRATLKTQNDSIEVFLVACELEVAYRLNPGFVPTDAQIEVFHSSSAVFHCWPYFREFVQSSITRAGYPAPEIPFLQLQVIAPKVTSPATPTPSTKSTPRPKQSKDKLAKKSRTVARN